MKRLHLLVAGLLILSACTELGYVKPGMTDEEFVQDSQDCAEIARHQAFRDVAVFGSRSRHHRSFDHRRRFSTFHDFGPSLSELEFRYRRICMLSRGYELAPLDDQGEEEGNADGP